MLTTIANESLMQRALRYIRAATPTNYNGAAVSRYRAAKVAGGKMMTSATEEEAISRMDMQRLKDAWQDVLERAMRSIDREAPRIGEILRLYYGIGNAMPPRGNPRARVIAATIDLNVSEPTAYRMLQQGRLEVAAAAAAAGLIDPWRS